MNKIITPSQFEDKKPITQRTTNIADARNRMRFNNPYPTREEYKSREAKFRLELQRLSDQFSADLFFLFNENNKFESIPHLQGIAGNLMTGLPYKIFDSNIINKASQKTTIITPKNKKVRKLPPEAFLYTKDLLLYFEERYKKKIRHYSIYKTALTEKELEITIQKVNNLLKLYGFSRAVFLFNPFAEFLRDLEEVLLRLDPSLIPDCYIDCIVKGRDEDDELEIELPDSLPDRLSKNKFPNTRFFIRNSNKKAHDNIIKRGQKVRVYQRYTDGIHFYGKLLDHNICRL